MSILESDIAALVAANPGQMTRQEYAAVAAVILERQPILSLVFGCGRDSALWTRLMPRGGVILFVEDDPRWAREAPAPVLLTRYRGTVEGWRAMDPLATMDCWPLLQFVPWDFVLVDGPRGDRPGAPGRLGPISFASGCNATVIIHDTHRALERECVNRYFAGRTQRRVFHLTVIDPPEAMDGKPSDARRGERDARGDRPEAG